MDVTYITVFLILIKNLSAHGCGTLKAFSQFGENGTAIGKIRFYPNAEWEPFVKEKFYEWIKVGSRHVIGFFDKGQFESLEEYDGRLSDRNFTLEINGMRPSDVDRYQVICFDENRKRNDRTPEVVLKLPNNTMQESTTSSKPTTIVLKSIPNTDPSAIKDDTGNEGIAVVIVMTVVIVALIVIILGLVLRMKIRSIQSQLDRRAIAKEEETPPSDDNSNFQQQAGNENVYNEIDDFAVMDPDITYAQVKETNVLISQTNITTGISPSLPRRDNQTSKSVEDLRSFPSKLSVPESDMQKATSSQDVYATVLPKEFRVSQKNGTHTGNGKEEDDGQPKSNIRKPQRSTLKKGGVQYKSMDCILADSMPDEIHLYSNTLPRSMKRKGSQTKTELTYIQIDHGPEANTSHYVEIEPKLIGEPPTAEYVSIDFEKKAFVAPIRKAPSSWYRKRKERKEKKKQMK